jgi:SAM-dependent methyltransferase
MWDERYSVDEYIFGTEPNSFLAEHAEILEDPVLSLAEGEGRNAVFLASLGFRVHGVDLSEIGLAKAMALARAEHVTIETEVADLNTFVPKHRSYGSVISIFAHVPASTRGRLYPLLEKCLKPGGILLLEAYTEEQLTRDTGGPRDPDVMMSESKILREFPHLEPIMLQERVREVIEGTYHTGIASVVQYIGRKSG